MIQKEEYNAALSKYTAGIEEAKIEFSLEKIDKTLALTLNYLTAAGEILIVNNAIRKIRWYDLRTIVALARLSYEYIVKLYDIWKQ